VTLAFLFVDATFRSGNMRCRVRKSRKKWSKIWCFSPQSWGEAPETRRGGHKN